MDEKMLHLDPTTGNTHNERLTNVLKRAEQARLE